MHAVFLNENECTVSEREFVFDGEDSKASSSREKFRSVSFQFHWYLIYGCTN